MVLPSCTPPFLRLRLSTRLSFVLIVAWLVTFPSRVLLPSSAYLLECWFEDCRARLLLSRCVPFPILCCIRCCCALECWLEVCRVRLLFVAFGLFPHFWTLFMSLNLLFVSARFVFCPFFPRSLHASLLSLARPLLGVGHEKIQQKIHFCGPPGVSLRKRSPCLLRRRASWF